MRDEKVRVRLANLIKKGERVLSTESLPPRGVIRTSDVDRRQYSEWRSQAVAFLVQTFGQGHTYTEFFSSEVRPLPAPSNVKGGLGILRAALDDITAGHLASIREIATAEVFSKFLEQADHLLGYGYHVPAASLAGAVLENGLRSLAKRKGITVGARDNLQSLNSKIADRDVYNRLQQKQVAVWIDVRNAADHGRFDDFTAEHVVDLIKGVRSLLSSVA